MGVRWLLRNGCINEALNLCSRSDDRDNKKGMSRKFLNANSIPGIEFFKASVRACQNNKKMPKALVSSSSPVIQADKLFERLHLFLSNWDSSLFESLDSDQNTGQSLLSRTSHFPDDLFSSEEKLVHFNTMFGFSQRSI